MKSLLFKIKNSTGVRANIVAVRFPNSNEKKKNDYFKINFALPDKRAFSPKLSP